MSTQTAEEAQPYRVLARKYRPQNFDDLIGQEALVRTLKNAIESGRIAHAFMLTGIRGVGKTTTARIIAKALNYTGADGKAEPTTGPTDDCELCQAIAEDRHPDVMEMDAASRTGVDDIREILDGVRYAPTSARYKVYIIDEVHMLSKAAFNALLKTLEEPPEHVKFIFATTEIRKVPVTVLSRCQRFDLRRVDGEELSAHYKKICDLEKAQAEDEALALITRAADGSVRDGLSLLDQAIALGDGTITAEQVKTMLGLADRAQTLDLLESVLTGDPAKALDIMQGLYQAGADPAVVIQDLLDFTHLLTKLRAVPALQKTSSGMPKAEHERACELSEKLSMPSLGRAWQILLKGLNEVNHAPFPQKAAEMIVIRLAYAADLPDPGDLIKKIQDGSAVPANMPGVQKAGPAGSQGTSAALVSAPEPTPTPQGRVGPIPQTLEEMIAFLEDNRAMILASQVYQYVQLVKLEPGRLEFYPAEGAPPNLAQEISKKMGHYTHIRWMVSVSTTPGKPTLAAQALKRQEEEYATVMKEPLVKNILSMFPGTEVTDVSPIESESE